MPQIPGSAPVTASQTATEPVLRISAIAAAPTAPRPVDPAIFHVPATLHSDTPAEAGHASTPAALYLRPEESALAASNVIPATFELAPDEQVLQSCDAADSCDDCVCDCCDDCPRWYVHADGLIVTRNNASIDQPVVLRDDTGATVLTTRDLDFGIAGGPRIFLGRVCPDGDGLEFGYFGVWSGPASARAVDPGNLDLPGALAGATDDFDNADAMTLTWDWSVQNAECNWSRGTDELRCLIGFRYFNLEEEFNIQAQDSDGDVSDYHINASNNLVGGQLGGIWRRQGETYGYGVVGKAGLFGNDAIQRQVVRDIDNTVLVRDARGRDTSTSFVGDVDLYASVQLSENWRIRAGYYLLWVTQVALAPDQLDFTFLDTSGRRVHSTGSLFMHGATAGLEVGW